MIWLLCVQYHIIWDLVLIHLHVIAAIGYMFISRTGIILFVWFPFSYISEKMRLLVVLRSILYFLLFLVQNCCNAIALVCHVIVMYKLL
jgi:hypothetical protein